MSQAPDSAAGAGDARAAFLRDRYLQEIPEWGHLPAAMRLKQAAVEHLGIDAAFELCRQVLTLPDSGQLRKRRLRSLESAARQEAQHYAPLWPARETFDRPALRVIGEGNHGPMPGTGRSAYLCRMDNVVVRSRSALVLGNEDVFLDFEGGEYAGVQDIPAFDPAVLHGDDQHFWTFEASGRPPEIKEAFHLLARNAVDFGHWLTEYLPRYLIARMANMPAEVPVLVDAGIPANMYQALRDLLPPETAIIAVPAFQQRSVGRLWIASSSNFNAFYPADWGFDLWSRVGNEPRAMARILDRWINCLGPRIEAPTGCDRLFLARKPGNPKKRLINREQIETLAKSKGFARIYPEDHSVLEQIRMIRSATHIIAPEGSNALLSWFARSGTRVCVLSPPYTWPLVEFNAILAERGIDLTVATGPDQDPGTGEFCGFWNDYSIDPGRLENMLEKDWRLP